MCTKTKFIFVFLALYLLFICAHDVSASSAINIKASSVSKDRFTLSWITTTPQNAQILYGATTSLGNVAYDVKGEAYEGNVHSSAITGLNSETTYYYDVLCGGVLYDNGGQHYTVTTAPVLPPSAGSDIAYGRMFLEDGVTPAAGAIVYISLRDNDGSGTGGDSQLCSVMTDENGYWYYDLKNVKSQTFDSYFDYSEEGGDSIVIEVKGPDGLQSSMVVDTSNSEDIPPVTLEPNVAPVLEWVGETGYGSDGLDPETGYASTDFVFKIKCTDANNTEPLTHKVYIDRNGDGDFLDAGEVNDMAAAGTDYSSGVIYSYTTTIPYLQGEQDCSYYFSFSDELVSATGNITQAISAATAINKPDIFQTLGISVDKISWNLTPVPVQIPAQAQVMAPSDRIKVINTGDGSQSFTLMIQDEDSKDEWSHSSVELGAGLNKYVLSAVFYGAEDTVDSSAYNEGGSDDVVTNYTQLASSTRFAYTSGSKNGQSVIPLDEVYLCFRLDLPTAVAGERFDEEHAMEINLSCQGE